MQIILTTLRNTQKFPPAAGYVSVVLYVGIFAFALDFGSHRIPLSLQHSIETLLYVFVISITSHNTVPLHYNVILL